MPPATDLQRREQSTTGQPTALQVRDGFGVDRLSLSFPVKGWQQLDRWGSTTQYGQGPWEARSKVGTVSVMVKFIPQRGVWGKVEANPSRFGDPDGCSLLEPRLLPAAMEVMWAAGRELLEPAVPIGDAGVTRVDVARDFRGLMSPALYVDGLKAIKRPYARRSMTYHDPQRNNAETLYVGSNAGGVRLYDQHAAYADKGADEGSLRWEVEARKDWLRAVDVTQARYLDAVAVDRLAVARWEWSQMGRRVTGPVHAVEVLQAQVRAKEISQTKADRLLGRMVRESLGYGSGPRTTAWRDKKIMGEVGVTCEALWSDDLSRQAVGRLDFETGSEFLELTA